MTDLKNVLLAEDPSTLLRAYAASNDLGDLEPALAALSMEIPAGYHHKDNWEHTLRALDRAIEREGSQPDFLLRSAVLFHDIGKPNTRKFEGKSIVTFRNHEIVGANMSRKLLKKHGYSTSERNHISNLVSLHMRAYGFGNVEWSDSAVRRLETDAGSPEALDRLLIVFVSDLTSKNRKHVRFVEDSVKRLSDRLMEVRTLDAAAARRPAVNGHEIMELFGLREGRELGKIMKYLNSDEGLKLNKTEAVNAARTMLNGKEES